MCLDNAFYVRARGHPINVQPLLGTYERIDNHMWNRTEMCPMVNGTGAHVTQGAGREVLFGKEIIGLLNLLDKRVQGSWEP